jgi:hypothetical protein
MATASGVAEMAGTDHLTPPPEVCDGTDNDPLFLTKPCRRRRPCGLCGSDDDNDGVPTE